MGQEDVMKILKKYSTDWLTNKEIAKRLGASCGSVTANTKALRRGKMIAYMEKGKAYVHRYKK